jgi:hypothetical protein
MRLVDLASALAPLRAPAGAAGSLVLEVRDELAPWNAGRWRIETGPAGCHVAATRDLPDATIDVGPLTALLAGTPPAALRMAGEAEGSGDALRTLHALTIDHPPFLGLADYF